MARGFSSAARFYQVPNHSLHWARLVLSQKCEMRIWIRNGMQVLCVRKKWGRRDGEVVRIPAEDISHLIHYMDSQLDTEVYTANLKLIRISGQLLITTQKTAVAAVKIPQSQELQFYTLLQLSNTIFATVN